MRRDVKKNEDTRWGEVHGFGYGETWDVLGTQLYVVLPLNFFYCIVERFSFILECRHDWSNHVKTSCIFM